MATPPDSNLVFEPDLIDLKMMRTKGSLCAKLRFHLIDNKWRFYYAHCVLPSPHSDNDLIWHTFGLDQSLATLYGPDHLVWVGKDYNAGILVIPLGDALGVSLHLSVLHHQNDLHDHFYILGLENWASSTIHNPMTKLRELAKTLGGWFCSVHEKKGSARGPPLSTWFGGRFWRSLKVCSSEKSHIAHL